MICKGREALPQEVLKNCADCWMLSRAPQLVGEPQSVPWRMFFAEQLCQQVLEAPVEAHRGQLPSWPSCRPARLWRAPQNAGGALQWPPPSHHEWSAARQAQAERRPGKSSSGQDEGLLGRLALRLVARRPPPDGRAAAHQIQELQGPSRWQLDTLPGRPQARGGSPSSLAPIAMPKDEGHFLACCAELPLEADSWCGPTLRWTPR